MDVVKTSGQPGNSLFPFMRCLNCGRGGPELQRYLPSMQLYVCILCIPRFGIVPIEAADIGNKALAPWNDGEVESLRAYQQSDLYAPFVCPNDHIFEVGPEGLVCFKCRKAHRLNSAPMQRWTYDWTVDWSWLPAKNV